MQNSEDRDDVTEDNQVERSSRKREKYAWEKVQSSTIHGNQHSRLSKDQGLAPLR
jgi:hypothetical protein